MVPEDLILQQNAALAASVWPTTVNVFDGAEVSGVSKVISEDPGLQQAAIAGGPEDPIAVLKGLENEGDNHCFLNVSIQAFWNLRSFRRRFLLAPRHKHSSSSVELGEGVEVVGSCSTHASDTWKSRSSSSGSICAAPHAVDGCGGCTGGSSGMSCGVRVQEYEECVTDCRLPKLRLPSSRGGTFESNVGHCCFCALQAIFAEYRSSEEGTLPPDVLRVALARIYHERGRFKLGEMEDATEAFEALLDALHADHHVPEPSNPCDCPAFGAAGYSDDGEAPTGAEASPAAATELSGECPEARTLATVPAASHEAPVRCWRRRLSAMSGAERVEEASNFVCHPPCVAHEVFGIENVDLQRCTFCGATGEPRATSSFVYQVYVAELLAAQEASPPPAVPGRGGSECEGREANTDEGDHGFSSTWKSSSSTLGVASDQPAVGSTQALLRNLVGGKRPVVGKRRRMPDLLRRLCQTSLLTEKCKECNSRRTVVQERWLMRLPYVFVISLVWPSVTASRDTARLVLSLIQFRLEMDHIFRTARQRKTSTGHSGSSSIISAPLSSVQGVDAVDAAFRGEEVKDQGDAFFIQGLICYHGMHYVAVFWCWSRMRWVIYDDTFVREVVDWRALASLIVDSSFVPTLLFYERADHEVTPQMAETFMQQAESYEENEPESCTVM